MATNFEVVSLLENIRFQFNRGVQAFFVYSGIAGDGVPPTVTLVSPTTGTIEAFEPITFNVTDNDGLGSAIVVARFNARGIEEIVHQGERFGPAYAAQSTRVAIVGGFRYTVRRSGGWPESPAIDVYATDIAGAGV